MRLDRILHALLPRNEQFYNLFEESAHNICKASEVLQKLPSISREDRNYIIEQIKAFEHEGDTITHRILAKLSGTFVTPFDPEDIHLLASALDEILDNIDGCAQRFVLYKVGKCPPDIMLLMQSLHRSIQEVERGMHLLRKLDKTDEINNIIKRINEYEDEADGIFDHAIADLFETCTDPIEIIKLKEIYVALETATDMCEDVANVMETILIKHA